MFQTDAKIPQIRPTTKTPIKYPSDRKQMPCFHQEVQLISFRYTLEWLYSCFHSQHLWMVCGPGSWRDRPVQRGSPETPDDIIRVIFSNLTNLLQRHRRDYITVLTGWVVLLVTNKLILICKIGGVPLLNILNDWLIINIVIFSVNKPLLVSCFFKGLVRIH